MFWSNIHIDYISSSAAVKVPETEIVISRKTKQKWKAQLFEKRKY